MNVRHHLATALLALASLGAQAATVYGSNLIVNGDAEGDMAAWQSFDGYALFQAVDYGSNWVLPTQPGPADRGAHLFTGVGARSAGYQLLDLDAPLAQPVPFQLNGWLGGWTTQEDNALFYVSFLDSNDAEIGHAALGPMMPADRGNTTGLFELTVSDWLPVGTARLLFALSMERLGGGDNDGYADNLSFVLNAPAAVPAPAPLALLGLGLAALAVSRRRAPGAQRPRG
jgi:hypothetical protein